MISKVSVIIPCYNQANFLDETLQSVLNQTYTNWECIVVDDGSTDNTVLIIEDYCLKDHRFQIVTRPKSKIKGANSCRNYGFEKSQGAYIQWFDSDDLMRKDKLSILVGLILDKKTNCVLGNFAFFREEFNLLND